MYDETKELIFWNMWIFNYMYYIRSQRVMSDYEQFCVHAREQT